MTDMLSIGLSGVRTYQASLTTTSENIANAGVAGYSRRSMAVKEVVAVSGMAAGKANGLGVIATGIHRTADDYRSGEIRHANSDLARSQSGITWMARIETALSGNQLADRITGFFNAATRLAADPGSLAPRAAMLETASGVANAFAATASALEASASALDASAESAIANLNALSDQLGRVNSGISRSHTGSAGAAALLDERDRLLEQMSAITDIHVQTDTLGRATVHAGLASGPVLVQGDVAAVVTYVRSEGAVSLAVHRLGEMSALTPQGGEMAGIIESAGRINDALRDVENQARSFAEGVNAVQANGVDLSGEPGAPMFAIGDPPSRLTLVMNDPRGIAAAAAGAGPRDNGNLTGFDTLRETGAFEQKLNALTTSNAVALSARRNVADAQFAMRDAAVSARDSISGVNLDEEAVDLLRFQQAYQASSRVIQTARETLNSILEIR